MNIAIEPHELPDDELVAFLAEIHALAWYEIHPSNRAMVDSLRETARAEIARRVFLPWWQPEYSRDFIPGFGYLGGRHFE